MIRAVSRSESGRVGHGGGFFSLAPRRIFDAFEALEMETLEMETLEMKTEEMETDDG